MNRELLLEVFNKNICGNNQTKGLRILNNDLVTNVTSNTNNSLIYIRGTVLSESFFSEYQEIIEIDLNNKTVLKAYCTCEDYEKNEFRKKNYCCKHLMAVFHYFIKNSIITEDTSYKHDGNSIQTTSVQNNIKNNLLDILLNDIRTEEEVKIEVFLNRTGYKNKLNFEFKIGLKSMTSTKLYVLKDINQFLTCYHNNIPIKYGKEFTLDFCKHSLSLKDKILVDFLDDLRSLEMSNNFKVNSRKLIDGKKIFVPDYIIRQFFEVIKNHRVYLNEGFYFRVTDCEILNCNPSINFNLKEDVNGYNLSIDEILPDTLSDNMDILLIGTSIYLTSLEYVHKMKGYFKVFSGIKSIVLPKEEEGRIFNKLIPELHNISDNLYLSNNIKEKVVMAIPEYKFYFDKENNKVVLKVNVKYDKYEFNIFERFTKKIIYRDLESENSIKSVIKSFGFDEINKKHYLNFGDDYIFRFFKHEIHKLQSYGEIYYSENFKGIKCITSKSIKGEISAGKYDYLEFKFKIPQINDLEVLSVIEAFRKNLKYYKLNSGEFLDLEEIELKNFLSLLINLNSDLDFHDKKVSFHKAKSLYINHFIENNKGISIKGKNQLKELKDKFKKINKLQFTIPIKLENILRNYQKTGYNWFRTLDYFGFGGILADEMGLGKTLQTISFLVSKNHCNSLIIAPTSLIYNWKKEFEKFAPNLNVTVVNDSKYERDKIIEKYNQYDVIITSYNLMKIDFEKYRNIEFNHIILDEAQNIKNPNSQNSIMIKKLKGKVRFALTGTPVENSLMELWSIFDFIMPGYLSDEKDFSVRYHKRLNERDEIIDELNVLIKPFILRRFKKDVIQELPDKINKTIEVQLSKEEKKVYATYAKYVADIIDKKVNDDEFNKTKIELLSYITKLRQLCLDPSIVMNDYKGKSSKIDVLVDLLVKSISEGHKVLVFSQFTSILSNVKSRLKSENILFSYLDGSISAQKRIESIHEFNEGNNSVFLISLKAGGTGLNLTSADIVIHLDPWWNPAVEDQATDRAHRIGQQKVVEVIKLIAKDTIEEKIISLQEEKRNLISKILGGELSSSALNSLNEEDIKRLFI